MESIIVRISHVLLLSLICGIVFILIQDPYLTEQTKLSIDIKQTSASNIKIYENSNKLLCIYKAREWTHYIGEKDEASFFELDCEDKFAKANEVLKQGSIIDASGDVVYFDKINNNRVLTQKIQYDVVNQTIQNEVFTEIKNKQSYTKNHGGFRYDFKNGILDMKKVDIKFKDFK